VVVGKGSCQSIVGQNYQLIRKRYILYILDTRYSLYKPAQYLSAAGFDGTSLVIGPCRSARSVNCQTATTEPAGRKYKKDKRHTRRGPSPKSRSIVYQHSPSGGGRGCHCRSTACAGGCTEAFGHCATSTGQKFEPKPQLRNLPLIVL